MELLFEVIFELLVEGSTEVAKNRKISKWIRYPAIVFISLFIMAIIGLLIFIGIALLFKESIYAKIAGVIFLIFVVILIISAILNIKKEIKLRKSKRNSEE